MGKHPLGLTPKYIWEEQRYQDIMDAMRRYNESEILVPQDWLEEAIELRRKIEHRLNKRDPKLQTYGG